MAESTTLAEIVYEKLRADIVAGELSPESRLRSEDLRARYEVGISPLREAMNRLTGEGLIVTEGQRGFFVAPVSLAEAHDLVRIRTFVEREAIISAVTHGREEWETEIIARHYRLQRMTSPGTDASVEEEREWETRHRDFHQALISACDSPTLLQFARNLAWRFERYRRLSGGQIGRSPKLEEWVRKHHDQLAEAALNRDGAAAADLIEEHFDYVGRIVFDVFYEVRKTG